MVEAALADAGDALVSLHPEPSPAASGRRWTGSQVLVEMARDRNVLVDAGDGRRLGRVGVLEGGCGGNPLRDAFGDGFGGGGLGGTAHERIRLDVYVLFHALVAVVRCCYRPSRDGGELAAGRTLMGALTRLAGVVG
jgi:hypothetical protein